MNRLKKYLRPTQLSDPCGDFSEEELNAILAKPDEKMGFYEFDCLFQSVLPAGEYDEVIYFFSRALDYVIEEKEEWYSLIPHLIAWINDNEAALRKDGVWDEIWKAINAHTEIKLDNPFRLKRDANYVGFYPKGALWFEAIDFVIEICQQVYEQSSPLLPNTEALLLKRFEEITSYDTAAWFVYLAETCLNIPILKRLGTEGNRKEAAIQLICGYVKKNRRHLQFWKSVLGDRISVE